MKKIDLVPPKKTTKEVEKSDQNRGYFKADFGHF